MDNDNTTGTDQSVSTAVQPQASPESQQSLMTQREPAVQPEPEPQPAPAAQPESEPAAEPEATPTNITDMIGKELLDDPASRIAARTLQNLVKDIDIARAFGAAYEHEDTTRIDKPYLVEKLGADAADEVLEVAEFLMGYADTVAEKMQNTFYSTVEGGKEQLEQSAAVFNKVADAETRAMVADMLDSGDMRYMQHAARIIQQTASKSGGQYKHNTLVTASTAAQAPMTREQYIAAIQNPSLTPQAYDALRARYAASLS